MRCIAKIGLLILLLGSLAACGSASSNSAGSYGFDTSANGKCTQPPGATTRYTSPAQQKGDAGLYVTDGESLYRLATNNGFLQPIWRYTTDDCWVEKQTPQPRLSNAGLVAPSITDVAVANESVYFYGRDRSQHYLYALRATDGALRWRKNMGDIGTTGLLALNGLLYTHTLTSDTYSSDFQNVILALDGQSGAQRWMHRYPFSTIDQAPGLETVGNGKVYVSTQNTLFALDAATGKQVWRTSVESQQTFDGARFFAGRVYATSSSSCFNCEVEQNSAHIYAFDAALGKQLWQSEPVSGYLSPPAETLGVVYVGSQDGSVYALHANDGRQVWHSNVGGEVRTLPRVSDGVLYVGAGHFQAEQDLNKGRGHIAALNLASGKQLWSYIPIAEYDGYHDIYAGNGVVTVMHSPASVDVLRASSGVQLQQYTLSIDYPNANAIDQLLVT